MITEAKVRRKPRRPYKMVERVMLDRLSECRLRPATFDKRFIYGLLNTEHEGITARQAELLPVIFKRYRRQIADYEKIVAAGLPPPLAIQLKFDFLYAN
jgi:hypothetical protein